MTLLRLHYLLETVIIVTLISYNWVLCIEEGSQGTDGKSWDRIIENPAYRLFEPNIFSIFSKNRKTRLNSLICILNCT